MATAFGGGSSGRVRRGMNRMYEKIREEALGLVREELARKYRVFPCSLEDKVLSVLCPEEGVENRQGFEQEVEKEGIEKVDYRPAPLLQINKNISTYYTLALSNAQIGDTIRACVEQRSVTSLLDYILKEALELKASDVHLFFMSSALAVRMRIKGELKTLCFLEAELGEQLIRAVKVRSEIEISKSRNPKDGKMRYHTAEGTIDVRVSVIATITGEKLHLRLLNLMDSPENLEDLEMEEEKLRELKNFLYRDSGFLLITGPTSSGKSTTMRCALGEMHDGRRHIISLEDPVEYVVEGITQVQVNAENEYGFLNALRAMLRQDPDVLAIGEVRDYESCNTAIQSSLTGHFVISTLHTKSAESAVDRIVSLGISSQLLALSLGMIINQRLVRILCPHCKEGTVYHGRGEESLGVKEGQLLYEKRGCPCCQHTGYSRRRAVFSIRNISLEDREMLIRTGHIPQKKEESITSEVSRLLHLGELSLEDALRFRGE